MRVRYTTKGWFAVTGWLAGMVRLEKDGSFTDLPDHQGRTGWQTILIGPYDNARDAAYASVWKTAPAPLLDNPRRMI